LPLRDCFADWKNAAGKAWPQFVLKPLPQAGSAVPLRMKREAFRAICPMMVDLL
jgi:hypothetical protein